MSRESAAPITAETERLLSTYPEHSRYIKRMYNLDSREGSVDFVFSVPRKGRGEYVSSEKFLTCSNQAAYALTELLIRNGHPITTLLTLELYEKAKEALELSFHKAVLWEIRRHTKWDEEFAISARLKRFRRRGDKGVIWIEFDGDCRGSIFYYVAFPSSS